MSITKPHLGKGVNMIREAKKDDIFVKEVFN